MQEGGRGKRRRNEEATNGITARAVVPGFLAIHLWWLGELLSLNIIRGIGRWASRRPNRRWPDVASLNSSRMSWNDVEEQPSSIYQCQFFFKIGFFFRFHLLAGGSHVNVARRHIPHFTRLNMDDRVHSTDTIYSQYNCNSLEWSIVKHFALLGVDFYAEMFLDLSVVIDASEGDARTGSQHTCMTSN